MRSPLPRERNGNQVDALVVVAGDLKVKVWAADSKCMTQTEAETKRLIEDCVRASRAAEGALKRADFSSAEVLLDRADSLIALWTLDAAVDDERLALAA